MGFGEEYFRNLRYSQKEHIVRRHVLETLRWGSKVSNLNLVDGRGRTALDIGCAYGYGVDVLESLAYHALGVDISRHGIKQAKITHTEDFLVCDVQTGLPFKNDVFDLITCFGVIEHLSHPLEALKSMFASCNDVIICTTPNFLVEKPVKKIMRDYDESHINVRSQKDWEDSIRENLGCSFVKIEAFLDASLRAADKLLFFRSFKIPYFGLDLRILIRK